MSVRLTTIITRSISERGGAWAERSDAGRGAVWLLPADTQEHCWGWGVEGMSPRQLRWKACEKQSGLGFELLQLFSDS